MYHYDLFTNKNGNYSYAIKPFGGLSDPVDKYLCGGLLLGFMLTILIGPFYFFSELSDFITFNPVIRGEIEIILNITKSVSMDELL